MAQLETILRKVSDLIPYANNSRTHSANQIAELMEIIKTYGFIDPVLIWGDSSIIAGHGRVLAAARLGMQEVPTIMLDHLSDRERKALILAHNKISEKAGWNSELLSIELTALAEMNFDLSLTGFNEQEIEGLLAMDTGILPEEDLAPREVITASDPKLSRAKSKIVHTCPKCHEKFSA